VRQALQDLPDITDISKHILMEDTKDGLNIGIVDQDGRPMFAHGSQEPNARTRELLEKMTPALKAMPYRLSIVGHTAATPIPPAPGYGPWQLSADRANAVRGVFAAEGVDASHIFMVAGKADAEPLFPGNPSLAPNRRVTITMRREAPPLPPDFRP
jgi:chemotaxis protein MotB